MKAAIGVIIAASATVTDPIIWPWHYALLVAVVVAICGSTADTYAAQDAARHDIFTTVGRIALSGVAAFVFFTILRRIWMVDSLQLSAISGVCGVYGRKAVEHMAHRMLEKIGVD